ncbi:MAG: Na+/H+ antiporter subunit D [Anaerolineae bacterium]|nr:Na+/H+ antiporter subunit D [Anaerolineae bacterium]
MNNLLLLPLFIPMLGAIIGLFAWQRRSIQRLSGVIGAGGLLAAGIALLAIVYADGPLAIQIGNWPAPFGITLVADLLSALMVTLTGLMGLMVMLYSLVSIDPERESYGYYPLVLFLLMGVSGAFLTGDMFNLYVWFEVLLIASFVLLALGGERNQLAGAIKYVTLNLIASTFFLAAVAILYSTTGTLNMADLALRLPELEQPGMVTVLAMLFLVSFGIKAAIFPLFFWLPDSYHTPPLPVTTLFSALLTKVGVYALLRTFTLLFTQDTVYTHTLLLGLAGFTMVTGVLGAVAQSEVRRLLSFHIISQIGYLLLGLGLYTPLALAGTLVFLAHVIITKAALFLVSGIMYRLRGTYELAHLGGFYRARPGLALLFLFPALSLAGLPPLSGFWAKFALIRAGLEAEQYVIVTVALGVSMLTLFSMTKIWAAAYWKPRPADAVDQPPLKGREWVLYLLPTGTLVLLTVVLGLFVQPLMELALVAGEQLLNPALYIETILGGGA